MTNATQQLSALKVLSISDGAGSPDSGYVVFGAVSMDEAKPAIKAYSGFREWPKTVVPVLTDCRLECWICGEAEAENHCCDEENQIWNFRFGAPAIVLMKDGRSVYEHFPPVSA